MLAAAWKARIRRTGGRSCPDVYREVYAPTAQNYGAFALTPSGLAVGTPEVAACYRLVATVPYRVLRPHLSRLGRTLVDGVRAPSGYRSPRRRRLDAAWFARSAQSSQQ